MTEAGAGGARSARLGILACAGPLPLEVAEAARRAGREVHIVGIDGFAPDAIEAYSHNWVNLGQIGGMLRGFRQAGCAQIVIAGGMLRPNLLKLKPDWGGIARLGTVLKLTRGGDDSVLRRIVRFFESEGFDVRGVHEVAPHLLAPAGLLGRVQPNEADRQAIARAGAVIEALGEFDVGQGAVSTKNGIIALEGTRGTDAMLREVAATGAGSGVLVKLPKPGQELRIDLPAIGPGTIELAARANLAGVAVRAGRSLLLERGQTLARADDLGLFVIGLEPEGAPAAVTEDEEPSAPLAVLGRRAPTPAERRDIALGRRLLDVLARHQAGQAAVIVGEHVLAIDASLPARGMMSGVAQGSYWGRRAFRKRIGVLIVQHAGLILPSDKDTEEADEPAIDFGWIADAGLAGIACVRASLPKDLAEAAIAQANARGIFLMALPGPASE
jgi:DUF1009 family protein